MKISIHDPTSRLAILLMAFLLAIALLWVDHGQNPGGSGIGTYVLWLLIFGILAAILYSAQQHMRTRYYSGYVEGWIPKKAMDTNSPWGKKANRFLGIWCLSEALVLFIILLLVLVKSPSFALIVAAGLGVAACVFLMTWSENKYMDAVRWLDPMLVAGWSSYRGPFFMTMCFIVLGIVLAVLGLSGFIAPVLASVFPDILMTPTLQVVIGLTCALFCAPVIIFLIYRRRE
jgi:hypothetical protein